MVEDVTRIGQENAGLAGAKYEGFTHVVLITGNAPQTSSEETLSAGAPVDGVFPAYSVVGRDSSGEIVLAQPDTSASGDPSNAIEPIGVTTHRVSAEDPDAATSEPNPVEIDGLPVVVWRDGCFNPDALNWSEAYDTAGADAKRMAFENGHSQVYIREPNFKEGV